ncbi:hypothetical protein NHP21005_09790 [Helicobacter sp. NHP21005]|uniref:hypothetical protein n=1 Tax=Helicobacter felistomachi TaxID=3040201 RepID=UPI00257368DB|nr:hypothetical protein [Helicobacter sp. NHP21005]BEG57291.1 hypothetical protein NHP21005_09790 [Helicobacter sp. NHP21005]
MQQTKLNTLKQASIFSVVFMLSLFGILALIQDLTLLINVTPLKKFHITADNLAACISILCTLIAALFAEVALDISKGNATLQTEIFLLDAYQKYIDAKHNCPSNEYKREMQIHFLATMDTCCKYVINGPLVHKSCEDNLKNLFEPLKICLK